MPRIVFLVPFLFQLLFSELTLAEEVENSNMLFKKFDLFDFLLINYANITYDVIVKDGAFLNAIYQNSLCKDPHVILNFLSESLMKPHTIVSFSRSASDFLECKQTSFN